ncbi:MAG: AAA family ATPase [Magnetococcus sp. DMHC-8]
MYQPFFNLQEPPFAITPDPRFLFPGEQHRAALAHLLYGIRGSSGFVLLTGEVGTGKTTLSRCLIEQVPRSVQVAVILNPSLSAQELIAAICDDLGIIYPATATIKTLFDALNQRLLANYANNQTTVLILDEVQNLSVALLEQVRLLSNLETATRKLLQIILIGQPELIQMLARPELRQFSQRITARYHLAPLTRAETRAFIQHRLKVAGCQAPLFGMGAIWSIHRASQGIPRLINQICDRALLGAYVARRHRVNGRMARSAIREVMGHPQPAPNRLAWSIPVLCLLLAAWMVWPLSPRAFALPAWTSQAGWQEFIPADLQTGLKKAGETLQAWWQARRVPSLQSLPAPVTIQTETPPTTPLLVQPLRIAQTSSRPPAAAVGYRQTFRGRVTGLTDGCHWTVQNEQGQERPVRLAGIACPPASSDTGQALRRTTELLVRGGVLVAVIKEEPSGTVLADVFDGDNSLLNRTLIRQGLVEPTEERFRDDAPTAGIARRGPHNHAIALP